MVTVTYTPTRLRVKGHARAEICFGVSLILRTLKGRRDLMSKSASIMAYGSGVFIRRHDADEKFVRSAFLLLAREFPRSVKIKGDPWSRPD